MWSVRRGLSSSWSRWNINSIATRRDFARLGTRQHDKVSFTDDFYDALFETKPSALLKSGISNSKRQEVVADIWSNLQAHFDAPFSETTLAGPPSGEQLEWKHHVARLSFHTCEEIRHILAEAWKQHYSLEQDCLLKKKKETFKASFHYEDDGIIYLQQENSPFSNLRTATIVGLVSDLKARSTVKVDDIVWAMALPSSIKKYVEEAEDGTKTKRFIKTFPFKASLPSVSQRDNLFWVYPLESALSYSRQLMTGVAASQVPLSLNLDHSQSRNELCRDNSWKRSQDLQEDDIGKFQVPVLNQSQERAAGDFMGSPDGNITLVQGPPGSGKTHFTVATIIRFLQSQKNPKLGVCAPTNKAVTVLALKYLQVAEGNDEVNIALIGDEMKLLEDKQENLRDIFVYTWSDGIEDRWITCMDRLPRCSAAESLRTIEALRGELKKRIPKAYVNYGLHGSLEAITEKIESNQHSKNNMLPDTSISPLKKLIRLFLKRFKEISAKTITEELLSTAHVIFSTLTSTGSIVFKNIKADAVIVDEAAACTELETLIPLYRLRPRKVMLVGDPKQLPATIMSYNSSKAGLGTSLLERLMIDCKQPYTMMDTQYRMHPEISNFSAQAFYDGNLLNGTNVTRYVQYALSLCLCLVYAFKPLIL